MKILLIGLIRGYKMGISPYLPNACRFHPTCSQYAIEAIERFGAAAADPWQLSGFCAVILFILGVTIQYLPKIVSPVSY